MAGGPKSYFDNPFEQGGDVSHASIFLVALVLLVGVGAILFYGAALALPSDPASLIPSDLQSTLSKPVSMLTGATPTPAAPAPTAAAPSAGTTKPALVVNAGPNGVFLCRTPDPNDRLVAWPDSTPLELLGDQSDALGVHWLKARDPLGNVGWVPAPNVQTSG